MGKLLLRDMSTDFTDPSDSDLAQNRQDRQQDRLDDRMNAEYEVDRGGTRWRRKPKTEDSQESTENTERSELIRDIIEQIRTLMLTRPEVIQIIRETVPQEYHNPPQMKDTDASADPCLKAAVVGGQADKSIYLGQALPSRSGKSKYMGLFLTDDDLTIDWDWPRFHA